MVGKGSCHGFPQLNLSLQMSPPPSSFNEPRSGGGSGGPLSHFYSGSPTSYFTSGLQAGLKQSHLNKVSLPYKGLVSRTIGMPGCVSVCLCSLVIQGVSATAHAAVVLAPLVPTVELPLISSWPKVWVVLATEDR